MQNEHKSSRHGVDGIVIGTFPEGLYDALGAKRLNETFDQIAGYIRELVGAHLSVVSYIPDGDFSRAIHGISLSDKYAKYRTYDVMPTGKGIWATIFETAKPMRLTEKELYAHPRFLHFSDLKDERGLEHPPMPGWLAVPVLKRTGEAIGVLQLSDRYEGDFTEEDQAALQKVAGLVAPTIEVEYLYEQVQRQKQQLQLSNEEFNDQRLAALNLAADAEEARQRAEQAEEALRAGEQRMRLATEATEVGIWEWNLETNSIWWDAQLFRIYGIAPTENGFVGYGDWSGAILPEDLPQQEAVLQDTVRRLGHSTREFRIRRRSDGEIRVIQAVEAVRANEKGEAEWVVGTNRDITERKRAEEQLQHQLKELVRWQNVILGREDRVRKLKQEINELLERLGEPIRYPSQATAEQEAEEAAHGTAKPQRSQP